MSAGLSALAAELYSEILQYLESGDFCALTATSKRLHSVATQPLYRHVEFDKDTEPQTVVRFLDTMNDPRNNYAALVQRLTLDWSYPFPGDDSESVGYSLPRGNCATTYEEPSVSFHVGRAWSFWLALRRRYDACPARVPSREVGKPGQEISNPASASDSINVGNG